MKRFTRQVLTNTYLLATIILVCGSSLPGLRIYAALTLVVWGINYWRYVKPFKYRRWRKLRRNGGSHTPQEWEALKRYQQYKCVRCGSYLRPLTKDHVLPVSRGGKDSIDNIQGLCGPCNSIKGTQYIDYRD